jgi:hypothetical protein
MTNELETRLRAAADGARQAAASTDTDALLDRIEGGGRRPAWLAPAVAVASAALVFAVVAVVAGLGTPAPRITDPAGSASPSPADTSPPSPEPTATETSSGSGPVAACSAVGLDPAVVAQPGLPAEVAALRQQIASAAASCDFEALGRLLDPAAFSYSFGVDGDPIGYWRDQEAAGGDYLPMHALRLILDAPHGRWEMASGGGSEYWVWPRLAVMNPEETPRDELDAAIAEVAATQVHTAAEVEEMVYQAGGYLGFRAQIEAVDGQARWVVFIAGD